MNRPAASANAQGYSLIDAVPQNAMMQALPKYSARFSSLFQWKNWSAISWIRIYYLSLVIFFVIFFVMETVWSFVDGEWFLVVLAVLFNPVLALMCIAGTRIVTEVMLAVLMIPHQLFQMNDELRNIRSGAMPVAPSPAALPSMYANMVQNENQQNGARLPSYHSGAIVID